MKHDYIVIIEPNGVERVKPLTVQNLSIGRVVGNDLEIGYDLVSRHHAQITFDKNRYYVTDLKSANGTYLGDNKLDPNVPVMWTPDQPLHIGGVVIHLKRSQELIAEIEDTRIRSSSEELAEESHSPGRGRLSLVFLLLVFLCVCLSLGAGAYFYFYYF